MDAAFLVTCQARVAEKAQLFFTTLLRRNLFQAAAAFIIVIIRGECKQQRWGLDPAQPRATAQRAVQSKLGEHLGEVLPKMKEGLLMNEAMTNWWPSEKDIGASKGSQNSFVYRTCK